MPKKICNAPGCHSLISMKERYCVAHKIDAANNSTTKSQKRYKKYDTLFRNKDHKAFYNSKEWKELREFVLEKNGGLCLECSKRDILTKADVVDHIIPIEYDFTKRLDLSNLQPLCHTCHNRKTYIEQKQKSKIDFYPKWIKKPKVKVMFVYGAPGSGKSTYVKNNAGERDLVIDLDLIRVMLTKKEIYKWEDNEKLEEAIDYRNSLLASLSEESASKVYERVWFIATTPRAKDRLYWLNALNAELVYIEMTQDECIHAVRSDTRRTHNLKYHEDLVKQWFRKHDTF